MISPRLALFCVLVIGVALLCDRRTIAAQAPVPFVFQAPPRFERTACPFTPAPDQTEGQTVTCGVVFVPEDRTQHRGSTIRLAVAIFRARDSSRAAPPLLFLGGGPGTAVLSGFAPSITGQLAADLTARRDLVLIDQRGVGFSQPSLACQELIDVKYQQLGQHLSRAQESEARVQAANRCHDRLRRAGVSLAAYTTAAGAADIDDIRRALGYQQVDLWGVSYGARLALAVMQAYPSTLRAVVLDSPLAPQVQQLVEIPGNVARSFWLLFDECAASPRCAAAFPNLEARFYQLVAEFNATPLRYQAQHPRTGVVHDIVLTGDRLVRTLFDALYHTDLIPILPLAEASLHARGSSLLALAAGRLIFDDDLSHGMNYSVQCAEEGSLTHPAQVAAARQRVRPEIGDIFTQEDFFRVCSTWGAARLLPTVKLPVVSAIPTLILSGQYDPITPPAYGRMVARTLLRSTFFEFPGVGHVTTGGFACAHSIMLQFLANPTRRPDAACIAQMGPPEWIIPAAGP
ncbi:MAG: alpha/beta fold hydrolase [Dehalococcoidia bacterium]